MQTPTDNGSNRAYYCGRGHGCRYLVKICQQTDADSKFRDPHISNLNQIINISNLSWTETWQASVHCASAQPQHDCHWGSASDVQRRQLLSVHQPPNLATISANTNLHIIYLHPMHLLSHWSAMSNICSKRDKLILQHATHHKINECKKKPNHSTFLSPNQ